MSMQGHHLNSLGSTGDLMLYTPSFMCIGQLVLEKIFKSFYHIWALWPYLSCDFNGLNTFLFPSILKATYMYDNGYNWLSGF